MTDVLRLRGVYRQFPGTPPVEVLTDLALTVRIGEYLAIVGPSGSGKSTLLHILGLLDRPSAGTYELDGIDTTTLSDGRRSALRAGRIGFVFQSFHLLAQRSIEENVMLAELYGGGARRRRRGRRQRARSALERVGLGHRLGAAAGTLSGGERQRVAIARALVTQPAILLCDEPTGNLDRANTAAVLATFDELHAQGMTIVVITHDPTVAARADRRVGMVDGRLVAA